MADRLNDGSWSFGRPLLLAAALAVGGPIFWALSSAETKAQVAARRASESTVRRLRQERGALAVGLAVTAATLVVGVVLVSQDLGAGRSTGAIAWVALALLAVAIVFMAGGISKRTGALKSGTFVRMTQDGMDGHDASPR